MLLSGAKINAKMNAQYKFHNYITCMFTLSRSASNLKNAAPPKCESFVEPPRHVHRPLSRPWDIGSKRTFESTKPKRTRTPIETQRDAYQNPKGCLSKPKWTPIKTQRDAYQNPQGRLSKPASNGFRTYSVT